MRSRKSRTSCGPRIPCLWWCNMDDFARLLIDKINLQIALARHRRVHKRKPVRDAPVWSPLGDNRTPRAGLVSLGGGCYMRTIARSGRK